MNPRQYVFNGLKETLMEKKYSNLVLKQFDLNPQEQRFATALFYTTLQNYTWMSYQVESFMNKRPKEEVMILMAMACAQYYLMDNNAIYAIVNETVELSKQNQLGSYSGLINSVLKKTFDHPLRYSQSDNLVRDLSINTSHPEWMVALFVAQLGYEKAKLLCEHNNTVAPLYVRLNPNKISYQEANQVYGIYTDHRGSLIAPGTILNSDGLDSGKIIIQDIASQQVVETFSQKSGVRFLDCCCAPGTKLSQLALFEDSSGVGIDLHPHRIELTGQLLKRWGLDNVELKAMNFLDYPEESFDSILCDVPCSGLGVLRRKPDMKFTVASEDLDELQELQKQILDKAYQLLKVNGELVYSTCTLNKKENEKQIEQFLARYPDMKLLSQRTLEPWELNSDGFYIAHCIKQG